MFSMIMYQRRGFDAGHYSIPTETIHPDSTIHQQYLTQTKTHAPGLMPGNMGYFSSHKEQYQLIPVYALTTNPCLTLLLLKQPPEFRMLRDRLRIHHLIAGQRIKQAIKKSSPILPPHHIQHLLNEFASGHALLFAFCLEMKVTGGGKGVTAHRPDIFIGLFHLVKDGPQFLCAHRFHYDLLGAAHILMGRGPGTPE